MKIPDATTIIALCSELSMPELLLEFTKEGYTIQVCSQVKDEVTKEPGKTKLKELVKHNQVTISTETPLDELQKFQSLHPRLGVGECSVILLGLKQKQAGKRYCCILDDQQARKTAKQAGLKFTGTVGMLQKLVAREKLSEDAYEAIIYKLQKSGFRIDATIASLKK